MLKQFALVVALCGAYASIRPALADPVNATAPVALFNVELLDGTDLSNASGLMLDFGPTTARGAGTSCPSQPKRQSLWKGRFTSTPRWADRETRHSRSASAVSVVS